MVKIKSFQDLVCWQKAHHLAVDVYRTSSSGSFYDDREFRSQMRRAAVSIVSNIAEGKERATRSEYIRFLFISKASVGELRAQLMIAHDVGYLQDGDYERLLENIDDVANLVGALIRSLKR